LSAPLKETAPGPKNTGKTIETSKTWRPRKNWAKKSGKEKSAAQKKRSAPKNGLKTIEPPKRRKNGEKLAPRKRRKTIESTKLSTQRTPGARCSPKRADSTLAGKGAGLI